MPPGRPRDTDAQQRILRATADLVGARGHDQVSISDIAAAAGVGKQTIYRWWPGRTAVVLDALVHRSIDATPMPDTGDARADFAAHLRAVAALFASPIGRMIREIVAEAQRDPAAAREFRERFWQPRRDLSQRRLGAALRAGQVRGDLDVAAALDVLYGTLWLRLLVGHAPLEDGVADAVLDCTWRAWTP